MYNKLYQIQFKPDYMCLVIDKVSDYRRACKNGFKINGIKYKRLLGTNGGVKSQTIVFVSEKLASKIKERIENGRNPHKELVPAKFEAYKALTSSGSTPVSDPKGILIVEDCITHFLSDIIELNDEQDGEPIMTLKQNENVELIDSDGYGLMLPSLAEQWSKDLDLDYIMCGANTRFSWEKGMAICFDFVDFADRIANKYMVKDAWGDSVDIRTVDLILTTSMVKLWDSYESCEHYVKCCKENGYQFGIVKPCPKELENERTLNYQFIQSYNLSDDQIEDLIRPTVDELHDILGGDYQKTILFLKGVGLTEDNVYSIENDFVKALMIDKSLINDKYIRNRIYQMIKKRIDDAKTGILKVQGNYSIVCGDPYSLCQSIFGLEVTGLLKSGEFYNKHWVEKCVDKVVGFRAPMTCHNNIRILHMAHNKDIDYWYQYITTCTVLNSWDTAAHAYNGLDKDADALLLVYNEVLLENTKEQPAIMCVQRKADKVVITEDILVQSNIDSFGDDIGKTTNWITSMFDVQAKYPVGSHEYDVLDYRIKCGQLFQQNAIDKAKGIIAKPMPKEWYDRNINKILDTDPPEVIDKKKFNLSILADKKPYFMRYIYPALMYQYKKYLSNTDKKCIRVFRLTLDELLNKPDKTDEENKFIFYYYQKMPVGMNDCVMNRICKRFEEEFDSKDIPVNQSCFDYSILKCGVEYSKSNFDKIETVYQQYIKQLQEYMRKAKREHLDKGDINFQRKIIKQNFKIQCEKQCNNQEELCDIVLDLCYQNNMSKQFAWDISGEQIILNLLRQNNYTINYPEQDDNGEIYFGGNRFTWKSKNIEGDDL